MAIEQTRAALLQAMRDLEKHADDTLWIGPGETVFERLATIYLSAGGDPAALMAEWPHYFGGDHAPDR